MQPVCNKDGFSWNCVPPDATALRLSINGQPVWTCMNEENRPQSITWDELSVAETWGTCLSEECLATLCAYNKNHEEVEHVSVVTTPQKKTQRSGSNPEPWSSTTKRILVSNLRNNNEVHRWSFSANSLIPSHIVQTATVQLHLSCSLEVLSARDVVHVTWRHDHNGTRSNEDGSKNNVWKWDRPPPTPL